MVFQAQSCRGFQGQDYCGEVSPRLSSVACVGNEDELLACPHEEGDDVFCAARVRCGDVMILVMRLCVLPMQESTTNDNNNTRTPSRQRPN